MDDANPHLKYNYSHDQLLMTAFSYEIRNRLSLDPKYDNVKEIVQEYLQERVDEIKDRWK